VETDAPEPTHGHRGEPDRQPHSGEIAMFSR
jgi:hypothetical protein